MNDHDGFIIDNAIQYGFQIIAESDDGKLTFACTEAQLITLVTAYESAARKGTGQ